MAAKRKNDQEILSQVDEDLKYIKRSGIKEDKKTKEILANIREIKYSHRPLVGKVGEKLADNNFAHEALKFLKICNTDGMIKVDKDAVVVRLYSVLWSFSAYHESFAKALLKADVLTYTENTITSYRKTGIKNLSKFMHHEMEAVLNIIENIIYTYPQCRQLYAERNVVKTVEPLSSCQDDCLRGPSIKIIIACVTEEEAKKLEFAGFIVDTIGRLRGYLDENKVTTSILSDTKALYFASVNDNNKKKMVDKGALPLLVRLMKSDNEEWQAISTKTIWTLCFGYTKEKVIKEKDCVTTLRKLSKSHKREVRKAAQGALWMIEGEENHKKTVLTGKKITPENKEKHIFISYSWKQNKDIVRKVAERLQKDGYKVWIDVDKMEGSTLEAMADAIENAYVCLMFYSESYRVSNNCRSEGEYVYQRELPIIPIRMQKCYKPDGWLGMLLGSKLYTDLYEESEFDCGYQALIKQIKSK